jgi:hypothetical protein
MEKINAVRAVCFLAGVLQKQHHDPFCGNCKAWVNSVTAVRGLLSGLDADRPAEIQSLPPGLAALYADARSVLNDLVLPADVPGQKKAGNCHLPPGICFVKSSKALLEKI